MRRLFTFFAALALCGSIWAQEVFTVVHATSDDGFLNVRKQASTKAPVIAKIYDIFHGMGNGVLRSKGDKWSMVSVGNVTGWAYTKYLGYQTWYVGDGRPRLVANKPNTPIYGESYEDASIFPLFTTVKKGVVIADNFSEEGEHYVLKTAHDFLFIKKTDAIIVK